MRRNAVIILAVISALLLGATAVSYSKYQKSQAEFAKATADQESMRLRYDEAVGEIVAIQDSLNAIVLDEQAANADVEFQHPPTLSDNVLGRIAALKAATQRTKVRIEDLDHRVKRSGVKIAGMEKIIANLRQSVSDREERIAQLGTQVDTLQTQVAGLSVEVQGQQQEIVQKEQELTAKQQELATIFYAMGTKKELTRSGLVAAKGGVLGVGKSLKLSGKFDESAFNALNTDQETVIRIPAEKVQVLSAQPPSSYALQTVGKDMVELRIINPTEFRKIKHLVILMA
jgi:peptidoglycan hydrolase CwlO-like protein